MTVQQLVDGTTGPATRTLHRLETLVETFSAPERAVVEHRLVCVPPRTLEEVGSQFGVTRERIRQIQRKVEAKVNSALGKPMLVLAVTLKEQCGRMVAGKELDARIEDLLPSTGSLAASSFVHP